jgi:O-6-methylguanine DNA methyltransferase
LIFLKPGENHIEKKTLDATFELNIVCRGAHAVGNALGKNPIPIIIPCHRVVAKKGIGGYSAGIDIKTRLLEFEKLNVNNL